MELTAGLVWLLYPRITEIEAGQVLSWNTLIPVRQVIAA